MNSKYQHIQHHKITRLSWTVSLINQTEGWAITLAVHRVGLLVRSTLFHDLHLNIDQLLSCVAISVIIICSPAIASIHTPTYMLLLYFSQGNPQMLKQSPDVPDTKYALNIKILLTGSAGLGHLLKKKAAPLTISQVLCQPCQYTNPSKERWMLITRGLGHLSLLILVYVKFAIWIAQKSEALHLVATVVKHNAFHYCFFNVNHSLSKIS